MLSIGKCSKAMAASYYEEERGYYDAENEANRWQGQLCGRLGIAEGSEVKPEDFEALLDGHDRAGFDLCFSADKSISVAAEMDAETRADMLDAHRRAVEDTLKIIESEAGTRVRGIDGNHEQTFVRTGNLAIAKVEHETSRAQDMDLHTHCVVMNQTEYNGQLYSLDARKLYAEKMRYGLEYRAKLAENLREKGYEVTLTDGEKGLFELNGIKPEVREHFSKRRAEIEAHMAERGESGGVAADAAEQATRTAKKKDVDINELRDGWRAELAEMGQNRIEKNPGQVRDIATEQAEAYARAVDRLSEKSYAFSPAQLQRAVMQEGVCCSVDTATADRLIASDASLIRLTPKADRALSGEFLTTETNLRQAAEIERMTAAGRGKGHAMTLKDCNDTLRAACDENGWKLGAQQEAVVRHICCTNDRYIAVQGLAGTGKTFILLSTREVLERQGYRVRGMSATGQAADELGNDAQLSDCATIHRQLNQAEREAGNAVPGEDYSAKKAWDFSGLKPSEQPTVWFCDEASLTDNKLFYHIQRMAEARGDKIVFVGDDRQMLPVGQGNSFAELVQRGQMATCKLDNIMRQKDSPELLRAVTEAVKGSTRISLDIISNDIREIKSHGHRLNAVANEYCRLSPDEQAETLVLTAKNADRKAINEKIRAQLVKAGQLQQGTAFSIQPDEKAAPEQRFFAPGDKVVFLRNDRELGVMNGTKGVISGIDGNNISVVCGHGESAKSITFDAGKYAAYDHGYCQTPNKAQGATVNKAIVHMSSADAGLNSKNSYYVDISRAKKNVKLFCDSREKLEPQLEKFATKITAKDFSVKGKASVMNAGKGVSSGAGKSMGAGAGVKFSGMLASAGRRFGGSMGAGKKDGSIIVDIADGAKKGVDLAAKAVEAPLDLLGMIPGMKILTAPLKAGVRLGAGAMKIGLSMGAKITAAATKAAQKQNEGHQQQHRRHGRGR